MKKSDKQLIKLLREELESKPEKKKNVHSLKILKNINHNAAKFIYDGSPISYDLEEAIRNLAGVVHGYKEHIKELQEKVKALESK